MKLRIKRIKKYEEHYRKNTEPLQKKYTHAHGRGLA